MLVKGANLGLGHEAAIKYAAIVWYPSTDHSQHRHHGFQPTLAAYLIVPREISSSNEFKEACDGEGEAPQLEVSRLPNSNWSAGT